MIFLLDVGNTRVKWGVLPLGKDASVCEAQALSHDGRALGVETLTTAWRTVERPHRVAGVCVAGEAVRSVVEQAVWRRWKISMDWVTAVAEWCGVVNAYAQPDALGADRWVALLAARSLAAGKEICVVDAGTAVTVDLVDGSGRHRGGAIFPGRRMMARALSLGTERLIDIEDEEGASELPARDTETALRTGIRFGLAGAVNGLVEKMTGGCLAEHRAFLTGGDAEWLNGQLEGMWELRPHLVLEGVAAAVRWAGEPGR